MCGQFGFEVGDLVVQFGDDADRGAGGRGECGVIAVGAVSCSVRSAATMT